MRKILSCLENIDDVFYDVYRFKFLKVKNTQFYKREKIILSTIHSAKGLEAKNVVLDLRVPGKIFISDKALEQEKYVIYVALTRAAENCYLCLPAQSQYTYLSMFPQLNFI